MPALPGDHPDCATLECQQFVAWRAELLAALGGRAGPFEEALWLPGSTRERNGVHEARGFFPPGGLFFSELFGVYVPSHTFSSFSCLSVFPIPHTSRHFGVHPRARPTTPAGGLSFSSVSNNKLIFIQASKKQLENIECQFGPLNCFTYHNNNGKFITPTQNLRKRLDHSY